MIGHFFIDIPNSKHNFQTSLILEYYLVTIISFLANVKKNLPHGASSLMFPNLLSPKRSIYY